MAKLKMNFKKFDFTRIKTFLINTGEKIVLGLIVLMGVWLVGSGLSAARYADKNKDGGLLVDDFNKAANNYKQVVAGAAPPVIPDIDTKQRWATYMSHLSQWASYIFMSENPDQTRRNPHILALYAKDIKIDFLKAGISAYEIDRDKEKATIVIPPGQEKESAALGQIILPRRLLIVSALFPLKEQTEEFQNALNLRNGIADEDDKPQILGINVYKIERDLSDPKAELHEAPLYLYDAAKNKIQIADNLDDLFRRALPDSDALKPFANHRKFGMLMTNMPKLASAEYPPLELPGFVAVKADEVKTHKDEKNPRQKQPMNVPTAVNPLDGLIKGKENKKAEAPIAKISQTDLNESPAKEKVQFLGEYAVFDGQTVGDEPKKDDPMGKQGFPFPMPPPMNPKRIPGKFPNKDIAASKDKDKDELQVVDPLIRFFDVDVKPGHEYQYKIQVRFKNPNFGLGTERVALPEMADAKELTSPWVKTVFTTIPSELPKLYVTDQYDPEAPPEPKKDKVDPKRDPFAKPNPMDKFVKKEEPKKEKEKEEVKKGPQPRGPDYAKADADRAPVQIHRWFDWADKASERGVIADWIIAERLLVRRGEYIGRPQVVVEAPTWSVQKNNFELINVMPPEDPKKKSHTPKATGIQLDFTIGKTPPVLVDFEGGHRKLKGGFIEDCPIELLAVNGDGKLVVHNSREDTYDGERVKRYDIYRARLVEHARPVIVEEEEPKKDKGPIKGKGPFGK